MSLLSFLTFPFKPCRCCYLCLHVHNPTRFHASSTISPPCLPNSGKFCLCISFYIHSRLVSRVTKSFWNFCSTEVVAWVAVVRNLISLNLHTPVSGPSVPGALPNMATHISATEIVTKVQNSLAVPLVSKRY